jgi:hypothetical protein
MQLALSTILRVSPQLFSPKVESLVRLLSRVAAGSLAGLDLTTLKWLYTILCLQIIAQNSNLHREIHQSKS